jgi:hypothetical protein
MKVKPFVPVLFLLAAWMLPWNAAAQNSLGTCNETTDTDCVNWEDGIAYAVGSGAPANWAQTAAQKNISAQRAARVDAARNLLELIKGINLSGDTTMGAAMLQNDRVSTSIQGRIAGLRLVGEPKYYSDGSIQVKMAGRLREMIPEEVYLSGPPQLLSPPTQLGAGGATPINTRGSYTGLVIDARGTGALPAMSPKVVDTDGREIYGSAYVSREFAVEQGIVGYAKDVQAAQQNDRVKGNPIVIKALESKGANKADVVISAADANALREIAQNQNFMRQTRVMIVLD